MFGSRQRWQSKGTLQPGFVSRGPAVIPRQPAMAMRASIPITANTIVRSAFARRTRATTPANVDDYRLDTSLLSTASSAWSQGRLIMSGVAPSTAAELGPGECGGVVDAGSLGPITVPIVLRRALKRRGGMRPPREPTQQFNHRNFSHTHPSSLATISCMGYFADYRSTQRTFWVRRAPSDHREEEINHPWGST